MTNKGVIVNPIAPLFPRAVPGFIIEIQVTAV